jgi:hypothetical protein
MQKSIGVMLGIFSVIALADDDFSYELSFGNHLELRNSGQEITITARNDTDKTINCGYFILTDPEFRHDPVGGFIGLARLRFLPKDENSGCSVWCSPIASPPLFMVAWNIAGPLLPGEEKVCKYEVQIYKEFMGTITLSGTNSPIFVTRVHPEIPVLSKIGICFLFILTLFLGIAHIRMGRHKTSGLER